MCRRVGWRQQGGLQPHAWACCAPKARTGLVQVRNRGKALADWGLAVEALCCVSVVLIDGSK